MCDLLPSLLSSSASDLTTKQLMRLFLRVVEFYVCYMASDSTKIQVSFLRAAIRYVWAKRDLRNRRDEQRNKHCNTCVLYFY